MFFKYVLKKMLMTVDKQIRKSEIDPMIKRDKKEQKQRNDYESEKAEQRRVQAKRIAYSL